MKEFRIEERDEEQRLIRYLERLLKNASQGFLYKMLRKKNITLNAKKASGNEMLRNGDVVRLFFSDETFEKFSGTGTLREYPPLDEKRIIYEDANILLYDKPAGLLSQQASPSDLSACELLTGYLMKKGEYDGMFRPSFVNRLDRNTTGLLIGAKNLKSARACSALIRDRRMKKEYITIVKGRVTGPADETAYLIKDEASNTVTVSRSGREEDKIETAYTPLKFCDTLNGTVLSVELKTGKTHQIRAHLSYLGYPVAGDQKYGDQKWNRELREKYGIDHQMLHSFCLTFPKTEGLLEYLSEKSFSVRAPFEGLYQ